MDHNIREKINWPSSPFLPIVSEVCIQHPPATNEWEGIFKAMQSSRV